ncbi:MAG: extracellular solute-binding protein [Treponema sp.]|jgi:putative aldouronate transport system substrate-binding protein|nr:extracellular solute-binding protein [Treponema sp.]
MKHFRTLLIMLLSLIALSTPLFARGGQSSGSSADGRVSLSAVFITHELTRDITTFTWLKELEQKAGVSVKWDQSSADWSDKKAALFASGDIPDMIFGGGAGGSDFSVYNGLFADLVPLIETSAPNVRKMFSDKPEIKAMVTQLDGKIYSLPQYVNYPVPVVPSMLINKTWLDRLNLRAPTNWDELKAVLIAFRDNDANGNGDKTDEIPMDFIGMGGTWSPAPLIGALGLPYSNGSQYFVEDGKVKDMFFDERYRTFMLFLRDLYAENLINREVVTHDYGQYQSIARGNGRYAKVGFTFAWTPGDRVGEELADQYIPIAPLKYKANSAYTVFYSDDRQMQNYILDRWSLSARTRDKEAAMRFADQFYDGVNAMQAIYGGITDGFVQQNSDGSLEVLPPSDPAMNAGVWKWTNGFVNNTPAYVPDYLKVTFDSDMVVAANSRGPYMEALKLYNSSNTWPLALKYSSEDNQTLAMLEADVGSIRARWAAWLVGEGNIGAEWNDYVKSAQDSGLNRILAIHQKAFDSYLQSMK